MKSILITGTNCTGKSTLVRNLIKFFGGVKRTEGKWMTLCEYAGKKIGIAGVYGNANTACGYDAAYKYKKLPEIAEAAKKNCCDYVFAEGMTLHTFGLIPTLFLFEYSDGHFVFNLRADMKKLEERLIVRTGVGERKNVLKNAECAARSAKKFAEIGADTTIVRTDIVGEQELMHLVLKKIGLADG